MDTIVLALVAKLLYVSYWSVSHAFVYIVFFRPCNFRSTISKSNNGKYQSTDFQKLKRKIFKIYP